MPQKKLGYSDEDMMEHHIHDWESGDFVNEFKPKEPKSKKPKKNKSKRIKKIEDYFQWNTLTEEQKDHYYEFVRTAKKLWSNSEYEDDEVEKKVLNKVSLMRFCIARDFKLDKVKKLWESWVEWNIDYQPHWIKWKEIKKTTLNKCFYLCKQNKNGNPCIIISPGATSETYDADLLWKLVSYNMEKAWRRADRNGTTQICVLFDRTGMSNSTDKKWVPLYKELASIIQDNYPERLNKAYVLGMNWIAKCLYVLIKPFIAKKTRNKLIILRNEEHLLEFFDEDNLQVQHGGTYIRP